MIRWQYVKCHIIMFVSNCSKIFLFLFFSSCHNINDFLQNSKIFTNFCGFVKLIDTFDTKLQEPNNCYMNLDSSITTLNEKTNWRKASVQFLHLQGNIQEPRVIRFIIHRLNTHGGVLGLWMFHYRYSLKFMKMIAEWHIRSRSARLFYFERCSWLSKYERGNQWNDYERICKPLSIISLFKKAYGCTFVRKNFSTEIEWPDISPCVLFDSTYDARVFVP